jgi:uncharacterized membrane protein YjjP (DUF1212 family)
MQKEPTEKVEFLMSLARWLHAYGTPAHRLEEALGALARRLELPAQFLCTPTSIIFAYGEHSEQRTLLVRVEPGQQDLGKLRELHQILRAVYYGKLAPADARMLVEAVASEPPRYPSWLSILSGVVICATSAVMLEGGWREIALAGGIGLVLGILARIGERRPRLADAIPVLGAFFASFVAAAVARFIGPTFAFLGVLAGLIVLLPGLTLTVAMNELAHGHLVSGTSRLVGALVTLLQLGVGLGVGSRLAEVMVGANTTTTAHSLPEWVVLPALLLSCVALVVQFRARPRDVGVILICSTLAYVGARLGARWLGPELGVAVGAWLVGIASNLSARWFAQPTAIGLVPGLILLVPGSLGLRSLRALLARDVLGGVEGGFTVFVIAIALVAGLFLANLTLPSRRLL